MADAGLFIGWGEVVRGREAEAVATFSSSMEYFGGLEADGTIESVEPVFLEPHGGDLQGFFFLRGDAEKLAALRVDSAFQTAIIRADHAAQPTAITLAGMNLAELEKKAIEETLASVQGNREQAAKILGIGERTLYRKIKEYGLKE